MFKAKINVGELIDCIERITAISDKGVLNISSDGLEVNMIDPANVAMVSFKLQSDAFDKFELEGEEGKEGIKIGLDFRNLLGMLKLWEREKKVELKLDEPAKKLSVKSGIFNYSISLLDVSSLIREPKIPKLKFSVQVIIEAEEFRRAIHAMERLGDMVIVGVEGEQFYMEAKEDSNVLHASLRKVFPVKKEQGNFRSCYSLEYLSAMCDGTGHAQNLTLSFNMDYPIQIDFDEGAGKKKIRYLLCPRIDHPK